MLRSKGYSVGGFPRSLYASSAGAVFLLLASAVLGISIANENYLVALAVALLPVILLFPVEASLGLFVLSIPFDSVLLIGQDATWTRLIGMIAGTVLVIYGLVSGRLQRPPSNAGWWGLFVLWASATVFWSENPVKSIQRLSTVISLCLLYFVTVSFRIKKRELATVSFLAILGGVLSSAFALHKFGPALDLRASLALGDQTANPNDFAATLLMPLSLAIAGFLGAEQATKKVAMMAAVALISLCVFMTMSRGALVAVGVLLLVFLLRTRFKVRLLAPILCLLMLLCVLPTTFFTRMNESFVSRAEGRVDIWIVGMQIVKHHGILGAGLDNFPVVYNAYAAYAPVFRGVSRAPHNIYLEVWSELGIVGLGLFAAAVVSQLKKSATVVRGSSTYLLVASEAACCALLAHGLVANLLWRKGFWMSWIFLALAIQLTNRSAASMQTGLFSHIRAEASGNALRLHRTHWRA